MRRPITLATAALSLLAAAPVPGGGAQAQAPPSQEAAVALDHSFVQRALARGLAQLELNRMAAGRAEAAEVRDFAERSVEVHAALNQRLSEQARTMGVPRPDAAPQETAQVAQRLESLEGAAFDQVFVTEQAQNHLRYYNLARTMAAQAQDPALRRLGEDMVPELGRRLETAQALRRTFRPIDDGPIGALPGQSTPSTAVLPGAPASPYAQE